MFEPPFGDPVFMFIWVVVLPVLAVSLLCAIPLFWFLVVPKPARTLTWARFCNWVLAFIQDDTGNVTLTRSDQVLAEGVIHNKKGWFFLPRPPYKRANPDRAKAVAEALEQLAKGDITREQCAKMLEKAEKMPETPNPDDKEAQDTEKVEKAVLQPAILRGLGKQVFFGYRGAALLTNIKTLAFADLKKMKEILPQTIQKSQFDALEMYGRLEGMEMKGNQLMLIIIALAVIFGMIIIVILAIVYLLPKPAPAETAAMITQLISLV